MTYSPPITAASAFDSAGASDTDRIAAVNAYFKNHGDQTVVLPARTISHTNQIELWSGTRLESVNHSPAREFSRSTVLRYRGPAGTSHIRTGLQQIDQTYPSSGAVRDFSLRGVQFEGAPGTHWVPKHDPVDYVKGDAIGVLWYGETRDCGWKGYETIAHCYLDGTLLGVGVSHVQGITDTPFYVGGSEAQLFGDDYSFMDNSSDAWATSGKPFIRSVMSKSSIGRVMVTARRTAYGLSVEGGYSLRVGAQFDAQDGDPMDGPAAVVRDTEGVDFSGAGFKGCMNHPSAYPGQGSLHIVGGSGIVVAGATFARKGTAAPADTPIISTGPNVGQSAVEVGPCACAGYSPVIVRQAKGGQVWLWSRAHLVTGP